MHCAQKKPSFFWAKKKEANVILISDNWSLRRKRNSRFSKGEKMSRLIIVTENEAQKTVEGLYRDLELHSRGFARLI